MTWYRLVRFSRSLRRRSTATAPTATSSLSARSTVSVDRFFSRAAVTAPLSPDGTDERKIVSTHYPPETIGNDRSADVPTATTGTASAEVRGGFRQ
jgi:hypothetical protein